MEWQTMLDVGPILVTIIGSIGYSVRLASRMETKIEILEDKIKTLFDLHNGGK